ncbi:hypothetical protein PsorP6_019437 [Peronosclerospora sorghi]|nr:hypothetical protein PsorP6_019437 [Peronosclerospora sorghi]
MNRAVIGAISVAFILYEIISLCGYFALWSRHEGQHFAQLFYGVCFAAQSSQDVSTHRTVVHGYIAGSYDPHSHVAFPFLEGDTQGIRWVHHFESDAYDNVQYLCAFCQDPVKHRWFRLGFPPHFYNTGVVFLMQSTAPIVCCEHAAPLAMICAGNVVGILGISLTLLKLYGEYYQDF